MIHRINQRFFSNKKKRKKKESFTPVEAFRYIMCACKIYLWKFYLLGKIIAGVLIYACRHHKFQQSGLITRKHNMRVNRNLRIRLFCDFDLTFDPNTKVYSYLGIFRWYSIFHQRASDVTFMKDCFVFIS